MTTTSRIVTLCVALGFSLACGKGPSGSSPSALSATFQSGTWVLTVDRALSGFINFPMDPIPESAYTPTSSALMYRLSVSDGGHRVVVEGLGLVGRLERSEPDMLWFGLTGGAPAGGRMVVWQQGTELQGELTLYGSGVPVTRSERGPLRK
jgi:hypothetical protein